MMKGIDVSHHQGKIDWDMVKASGVIDFVIIRASHGMNEVDRHWERNYREAKRVGLLVGAYHYFYYGDPEKHRKEVQNFLRRLAGKELDLPAFVDYEEQDERYSPSLGSCNRDKITKYAISDFDMIRNSGFIPGFYANKSWLTTKVIPTSFPQDVAVWLAEWRPQTTYKGFYSYWQYTSKGTVAGIRDGVDMNYCLRDLLRKDACPYKEPTHTYPHRLHFSGESARWFQWHLIRAGYDCGVDPNGKATDEHGTDGFAWAKTWDAIEDVTRKAGLGVGNAGVKTRRAIMALKSKIYKVCE